MSHNSAAPEIRGNHDRPGYDFQFSIGMNDPSFRQTAIQENGEPEIASR